MYWQIQNYKNTQGGSAYLCWEDEKINTSLLVLQTIPVKSEIFQGYLKAAVKLAACKSDL